MDVLIGIPAYNEERNIEHLLDALKSCSGGNNGYRTIVLSSGSTDKTDVIVKGRMVVDRGLSLVTEKERSGKTSALNLLLQRAGKSDVMVYLGADNIPEEGAVEKLCEAFKDPKVGLVGAHPMPVDSIKSFWGWAAQSLWGVHHLMSLKNPKISGELCAIRPGIICEVPTGIVNDDMYMQIEVEAKGYRVVYLPDVHVFLKAPSSLRDFVTQRKRILIGHIQLQSALKKRIPSMNIVANMKLFLKAMPNINLPKKMLWSTGFLILYAYAQLLAEIDFLRKRIPVVWNIAESTKKYEKPLQ